MLFFFRWISRRRRTQRLQREARYVFRPTVSIEMANIHLAWLWSKLILCNLAQSWLVVYTCTRVRETRKFICPEYISSYQFNCGNEFVNGLFQRIIFWERRTKFPMGPVRMFKNYIYVVSLKVRIFFIIIFRIKSFVFVWLQDFEEIWEFEDSIYFFNCISSSLKV